jgi:hypothetical protein
VHFGDWFPLAEALHHAPEVPGVLQARAGSIFAYTRGQSAMVYYTCSGGNESLRDFMIRCGQHLLSHIERSGGCLIRFGETEHPEWELTRLLQNFTGRFGSPPIGNLERSAGS